MAVALRSATTAYRARPLSWRTGTEIIGLDLSRPEAIAEDAIIALRTEISERCILLFRDQDLSPEQQIAFTRRFGFLASTGAVSRYTLPGYPDIMVVTNLMADGKRSETATSARMWHSDQSFMAKPAMGSLLYCKMAPELGGDTVFANMVQAYEALSDGLKATLAALRARHAVHNTRNTQMAGRRPYDADENMVLQCAWHPMVRTHPESRRRCLFISDMLVDRFEGWTVEESEPLLDYLAKHCAQPAFTYRHHWRKGDLIFWDNRCTIHHAPADYDTENMDAPENQRLMYRTTLAGDIPF